MPLDREEMLRWYRRNRARSRVLFDLLADEAYYSQPIALRHPIVFYEGHLPGFSFNTLVKRGLGRPSIDARLEALFARGIDPDESAESQKATWPERAVVEQFAAEADREVVDALSRADIEQPGHPLLDSAEAVFAILEHEAMHQETLLYICLLYI
jgi:iron(II)-dependent oxidoreductase